jgi:hypothetical protein
VSTLHSDPLDQLVLGLVDGLYKDNSDFAADMLGFHLNVCRYKFGASKVLTQEYLTIIKKTGDKMF